MSKVYQITVREELCRSFYVRAKSADEADAHIRKLYRNNDIVLDADDYVEDSGEIECVDEMNEDGCIDYIDYDLVEGDAK